MIPTCFSNPQSIKNSSPSSSSSSSTSTASAAQMPQNLITCIYQTQLFNSQIHLTLTWSKTLFSHTLTIHAPDFFSITIPLYPSTFPFFRNRPGYKSVYLDRTRRRKMKLYWDFTRAVFSHNSAEPESGFYFAIACNSRMEFYLGDRFDELIRRTGTDFSQFSDGSNLLSRREHVFGHKSYVTRAQFMGSAHEIGIECAGGMLKVKVDGEIRIVVKRLAWKFRGNEKIFIDGVEVEFYWDVFNWINKCDNAHKNGNGHGVFVFQVGDGGIWPEMVGAEKKLMKKSLSTVAGGGGSGLSPKSSLSLPQSPSCSSVLQWAEESSDCGRSSCSSTRSYGSGGGFSLLLYAWKKG